MKEENSGIRAPDSKTIEDKEKEDNDFLKSKSQFGRVAKISATAGGTAFRLLAEKYLGIPMDRLSHSALLTSVFGDLKGPLMKAVQLLSSIPGALPEEYMHALSVLQAQAPSMGWPFVRRRMRGELGPQWESKYASFTREASYAASLGQVHRAESHSGMSLAVKLQYPDMNRILETDLGQVRFFFSVYQKLNEALNMDDVYQELKERLLEEIDYSREAKNIQLFQHIYAESERIALPTVVEELSTSRLLSMSWLSGKSLKELADWSQQKKNDLAKQIFIGWYMPLYDYGVVHGDPHLGNYTFTDKGVINLFDFGCIRFFSGDFIEAIISLYRALQSRNPTKIAEAFSGWGFTNLSSDLLGALTEWAYFLYDPLLDDRTRTIHAHHGAKSGHEMAMAIHRKLNASGGVKPPREFVLMDRAAVGIGAVCMHLGAENNWHRLFHQLIDDFSAHKVQHRQKDLRQKVGI